MEKDQNKDADITRFSISWPLETYLDPKLWNRTRLIRNSMTGIFGRTLMVTSTVAYPCPDFIVKVLSSEYRRVKILHTWKPVENSKYVWSGSVAFYKDWAHLKKAGEHITREFEDIQALCFLDFIYLLIIAERSHHLYDVGKSQVIIKGPRSFEKEEYSSFRKMLNEYGELQKTTFFKSVKDFGKIAIAEYRFATHAFVAMYHLNGVKYKNIGFLHAEVVMTEKEINVKNEVARRFAEHIYSVS